MYSHGTSLGTVSSASWEMLPIEKLREVAVCCSLLKVGKVIRHLPTETENLLSSLTRTHFLKTLLIKHKSHLCVSSPSKFSSAASSSPHCGAPNHNNLIALLWGQKAETPTGSWWLVRTAVVVGIFPPTATRGNNKPIPHSKTSKPHKYGIYLSEVFSNSLFHF